MRRPTLLFIILVAAAGAARAESLAGATQPAFASGMRAYEAGRFEDAARIFEVVLLSQPDCARCAHLLGKSYGRLAEQANGLLAMGLARKTRSALELSVELDPDDAQAVEDLIEYYRAAPGFLGGNPVKARALELRLHHFGSDSSS